MSVRLGTRVRVEVKVSSNSVGLSTRVTMGVAMCSVNLQAEVIVTAGLRSRLGQQQGNCFTMCSCVRVCG